MDSIRESQTRDKKRIGIYGRFAKYRNLSPDEAAERINNGEKYTIRLKSSGDFNKKFKFNDLAFGEMEFPENDIDIPINGRDLVTGEALPTGKDLTFAVRVQGLNKTNKSTPSAPIYADDSNRPLSCHGVAVNNNQDSPDFGAVYYAGISGGLRLYVPYRLSHG